MNFRNLKNVTIESLVECLTASFAGYFVKMPSDVEFWRARFENARVDKMYSWGAFENDQLIGFVINGIDLDKGLLTAYNTGTGVLPKFRGNKIVDKLYEFGLSDLKKRGVKRCTLEVIDQNEIAIRVYNRIGFKSNHKLYCFKGTLETIEGEGTLLEEVTLAQVEDVKIDKHYSWDNSFATIRKAGETYKVFQVLEKNTKEVIGYFIINPKNGYIAQLESKTQNWKLLFAGISQIQKTVRINNIKEDRKELCSFLTQLNFDNSINQIEMEMRI